MMADYKPVSKAPYLPFRDSNEPTHRTSSPSDVAALEATFFAGLPDLERMPEAAERQKHVDTDKMRMVFDI